MRLLPGEWACVCGSWHTSDPHVITDLHGRVIHAPVSETEEVFELH